MVDELRNVEEEMGRMNVDILGLNKV